jgi:hypothetical protein
MKEKILLDGAIERNGVKFYSINWLSLSDARKEARRIEGGFYRKEGALPGASKEYCWAAYLPVSTSSGGQVVSRPCFGCHPPAERK